MQQFHSRKATQNLSLKRLLERKKKKRALEAAIRSIEKDITAEKENNLTLLTKANSFRVIVRQKKEA